MTVNLRSLACLALGLTSTFLVGCGMSRPYPQKALFAIDPGQPTKLSRPVSPCIVLVQGVHVASPFDAQTFFYKRAGLQYEMDYYNGFIAPPEQLLGGSLRAWLSQSGLFTAVVGPGGRLNPQYVLEGNVTELCGDYSDAKAPKARMAVSFFFVDIRPVDGQIVFQKSYQATAPISGAGPDAIAAALNAAYKTILVELTDDLARVDYAPAPVATVRTGEATTQPASTEPAR